MGDTSSRNRSCEHCDLWQTGQPQWWRHTSRVPKAIPGCQEVNSRVLNVALIRQEVLELVEQDANAFEKVWANRT
jgi:hypothetical protein